MNFFASGFANVLACCLCFGALAAAGVGFSLFSSRSSRPRFKPEFIEGDQEVVVGLTVIFDKIPVGRDEGVLGVDEDTFFFVGTGCSFALGAEDVEFFYQYEEDFVKGRGRVPSGWLMRIRHPQGDLELKMEVSGGPTDPHGLPKALQKLITENVSTSASRSFPPVRRPPVVSPFWMKLGFGRKP